MASTVVRDGIDRQRRCFTAQRLVLRVSRSTLAECEMYIGIDLGTSGVKAVLTNSDGAVVATTSAALTVSQPYPRWIEQSPSD